MAILLSLTTSVIGDHHPDLNNDLDDLDDHLDDKLDDHEEQAATLINQLC